MKKIITISAIALTVNCLLPTFSFAQICLGPVTNFGVGYSPLSITSADFNGDGFKDLATASINSNNVSVLLGTGTGSFGPGSNFTVGTAPYSVISADFNGDGNKDLAVANSGSNDVSILLGTGTGSFGAATNFTVGNLPYSVFSADFNGDANADLAVANYTSNNVSILLGTGTGSFSVATNFTVSITNAHSVTSADFNSDGKADLAVGDYNSSDVSILLGTGTGSFGAATNFIAGFRPWFVISSDFNGDGKVDLATANYSTGGVSILLGTGTGSFGAATNFITGSMPFSVCSSDFNGDGKIDLATANYGDNNVSILIGTGTGSFGSAINFTASNTPISVTSADFNGDAKPDLAAANNGSNDVSILLNVTPFITVNATATVVCSGTSITLTAGGATTYTWSGGVTNGVAFVPSSTQTYTVTGTTSGCSNPVTITIIVNPVPIVNANATATVVCIGTSVTLTGSGASTYTWTGGVTNGIAFVPSSTQTYTVTGTSNNCSNTASVSVNISAPSTPDICMVTVDSLSLNNLIIWDKTMYPAANTFLIYRDTANNNFALIGSVPKTALSEYTDTARHIGAVNGDPNITTYRYKLAYIDTCGNTSAKSLYHNTVYMYNSGSLFLWNQYGIEGQPTPVTGLSTYSLMRDNLGGTGNYTVAASASASSTSINDPQYATYQTAADWRVQTNWTIACTPTLRYGNNSTQGAIVRSKSNITNNRGIGIQQLGLGSVQLKIYPNPSNGIFTIQSEKELGEVSVYNSLGEIVYQSTIKPFNHLTIDISNQPAGIYILQTQGKHSRLIKE